MDGRKNLETLGVLNGYQVFIGLFSAVHLCALLVGEQIGFACDLPPGWLITACSRTV